MKLKLTMILLLIISMIGVSACSKSDSSGAASSAGASAAGEKVKLTFWSWGESDIPGFDKWLDQEVKRYQEVKPNVAIEVVKQSTDTLTSAFQAAGQTNSGPDIATLWATLPVLSQVWSDYLAPMDDYVSKDEMSHWMSKQENEYDGKTWGMPIYMMSMVLAYNKELFTQAGLDSEKPIETWDQFLDACAKLKAKGITPIGMGNQNGYTGGWLFSTLGKQQWDSIDELKKAVIGQDDITSDKFLGWYSKYEELVAKGYFNNDISSLDLDNGWKLFPSGKAAMSWTSDGNYFNWLSQMGSDKIGAMKTPVFGEGKLAQAGTATMSSAYVITKWSSHKQEAADFLTFLHSDQSLKDWYEITHAFPADDRFDASVIKDPEVKKVREWETTGEQIWPEIYLPPMVTENAEMVSGQIISSKSGSMDHIKNTWKDVVEQWRAQHPDELANYEKWTK